MQSATKQIVERLIDDFPLFAEKNLKIKPKQGPFIPLILNRPQQFAHDRVEDQIRRIGKVRIVAPKARQTGFSTYVGGRFYHQTTMQAAISTLIFAHDVDGTNNLFDMVKNYYEFADPRFRPELGRSNIKELLFPRIKSGYRVGTAGSKGLGRSKTIQKLHWSEVAHSPNPDSHAKGVVQSVPDLPDTEIFLESTANGQGDYFHRMYLQAMSSMSDWEVIFIPFYWQEEYVRKLPPGFTLKPTPDAEGFPSEQEYFDMYRKDGLTKEHLCWRRHKTHADFESDPMAFMQEYPMYAEEAFITSAKDSYIPAILVRKARNSPLIQTNAPLVIGADPAREGGDKFRLCFRSGRNVHMMQTLKPGKIPAISRDLVYVINKYKPKKVFIDAGGLGVGVYDLLVDWGYSRVAVKVDFGSPSREPDKNKNVRAEMYRNAKAWLLDEPVCISLPPKEGDNLEIQLSLAKAKWVHNTELLINPKEEIKKDLGFSPDDADAFILTFAQPVNPEHPNPLSDRGKVITAKTGFKVF